MEVLISMVAGTKYKVIGKSPIRHDGYDKVTGKAKYGADIHPPGLLHGKILRSPHAHARILSIDTSEALKVLGVKAVVTSDDLADTTGMSLADRHMSNKILASGKVLHKGHGIVGLVAVSQHIAEEALALVKIEYEVLPSVITAEEAIDPNAPLLHEEYKGNIAAYDKLTLGDIKEGFDKSDVVVEREFRTQTVHQGYIEPHTATASWASEENKITLWCSSQGHFQIGENTATVLGIPSSKVKVIPMEIGGGFGGKTTIYVEPVAALLSKKTGAPVKITMTRAEVLEASGPTSGSYMKVKMGADKNGKIVAADATLKFEAGAWAGSPVGAAAMCIFTPYDIENVNIDAYDIVDNKPKTTAYRAPGAPIGSFAAETLVDELSEKLSIDPIDFRISNGAKEGTRRSNGVVNNPIVNK